jgi:putative membrane protein
MTTAACAGFLLAGAATLAEERPAAPGESEHAGTLGEQAFLERALSMNEAELALGKLASDRGDASEVKAMGQQMVEKHTALGQWLRALAAQAGVTNAPERTAAQERTYQRIAALAGSQFDEQFKEAVNAGHVEELSLYRNELSVTDPALKALAEQRVALLEANLAKAGKRVSKKQNDEW